MKRKSKTDFRVIKVGEEEKKLSVAHCKKLLKEEAEGLSDEEILEIRDYFYRIAAITMEDYEIKKEQQTPVINLEHYKTLKNEKESYHLRAS